MAELHCQLSRMVPFGRPVNTDFKVINTMMKQGFSAPEVLNNRRPAWKPYVHKGKQKVTLIFQEYIDCVQYDKPSVPNALRLSGKILCLERLSMYRLD